MTNVVICIVSLLFGMLRVAGFDGAVFQALAHIWVGILIGAWLRNTSDSGSLPYCTFTLCMLEITCAAVDYFNGDLK